jgi:hypothetical protein
MPILLWVQVKVGKLYLVDLAGSERLKKSKSVGLRASGVWERCKTMITSPAASQLADAVPYRLGLSTTAASLPVAEARSINLSLTTLGMCISARKAACSSM